MSESVQAIGSIISNSAVLTEDRLKEVDPNGKEIMNLIVKRRAIDDVLIWRFDPNKKDWLPFFSSGVHGLKEICDFFMFVECNMKQYLLVIEMKLSSRSAGEQLKASSVLANYILASAKRVNRIIGDPKIVKVRIVGGKPTTSYRQPSYEHESDYISYRFPIFFDIKQVLDVYEQNGARG